MSTRPRIRKQVAWIVGTLLVVSGFVGLQVAHSGTASGGKIVFAAYRIPEGDHEIYSMNPDGTEQTNLTRNRLYDVDPAIAPGGAKIAFARQIVLGDHDLEIFVMNADGSDQRNLTDKSTIDRCPAWSPDARQIAFIRGDNPYGHPFEIYVMNADGSDPVNVSRTPALDDSCPTWSPDGREIAYTSEGVDGNGDVFVAGFDGSDRKNVTNDSDSQWAPDWSPDGTRIAYSNWSVTEANRGIYTMSPDGNNRDKLVDGSMPTWSADGASIAYAAGHGIYRIELARRSEQRQLTSTATGIDTDPDWQENLVDLPPRVMPREPAPTKCKVPPLVGLQLATARTRIRRAKCAVGRVKRVQSRRHGVVLGQSPRRSAIRPGLTRVRLLVGRR